MDQQKVCEITYQSQMQGPPKTYYIKPLKLFSSRDTIYIHARWSKPPGKKYKAPKFDPFLPIHRMKDIKLTDISYEYPSDYNFAKEFTGDFGIMKGERFKVTAEFTGWAAQYVAERMWSADQKITSLGDGKIRLAFTASSEPELIGWLLSFGENVKVISPKWIVNELGGKIEKMRGGYR